jgi:hypothetical protein
MNVPSLHVKMAVLVQTQLTVTRVLAMLAMKELTVKQVFCPGFIFLMSTT